MPAKRQQSQRATTKKLSPPSGENSLKGKQQAPVEPSRTNSNPNAWTEDDQRLYRATLSEDWRREHDKKIEAEIWERCPGIKDAKTHFLCRIRIETSHSSEIVDQVYKTCCEILDRRAQQKTLHLLEEIYDRKIQPSIKGRKTGIWQRVESYLTAAGISDPDMRKTLEEYLDRVMGVLERKWLDKADKEKIELKYDLAREEKTLEKQRALAAAQANETKKVGPSDDGKGVGSPLLKGQPDIVKRRAIVVQNPSMNAADVCKRFDFESIPLPETWDAQDWSDAYKKPQYRPRIQTIISKDRRAATT